MREADAVAVLEHHRPGEGDLSARGLRQRRHEQAQAAGDGEDAADDHLADLVRLAMVEAPPLPECRDRSEHREADGRVYADQPSARILESPKVELLVAPDEVGVEDF